MFIATLFSSGLYALNLSIASLLISITAWIAYWLLRSKVGLSVQYRCLSLSVLAMTVAPFIMAATGLVGMGALEDPSAYLNSKPQTDQRESFDAVQATDSELAKIKPLSRVEPDRNDVASGSTNLSQPSREPASVASQQGLSVVATQKVDSTAWLVSSLLGIWVGGSIVLCIRFARGLRAVRALRLSASPVHDLRILQAVEHGRELQRINQPVEVLSSQSIDTPIVIGVRSPAIIVPSSMLSYLDEDQLKSVLLHELAHIQRGDIWNGILQRGNETLFWWNPFMHLVHRSMNRVREWICDDIAVAHSSFCHSLAYAILAIAEASNSPKPFPTNIPAIGFTTGARGIQDRILRLVQSSDSESRKWEQLPGALVVVLALLLLIPTFIPTFRRATATPVEPILVLGTSTDSQFENADDTWKVKVRAVDAETGKAIPSPSFGVLYSPDLNSTTWQSGDNNGAGEIEVTSRTPAYLYLLARADGYAPLRGFWRDFPGFPADELPEELVFSMTKAMTVGGTVVDELGEPVEGATVLFSAGTHRSDQVARLVSSFSKEEFVTNAQGEWRCKLAPVDFNSASIQVSHPKYVDFHLNVGLDREIPSLKSFEHRFTLKKGFILSGQVLDELGEPVPQAILTTAELNLTSNSGPFAKTDDKGFYRFEHLAQRSAINVDQTDPMAMSVFVAKPGYAPIHAAMPGFAGASMEGSTLDDRVLDFVLSKGTTVELKVVDSQGSPIPNVTVLPWEWDSVTQMTALSQAGLGSKTDAQGNWNWSWAPPNQKIRYHLFVKGFMDVRDLDIEPDENGVTKTITLKGPQVIVGKVIDAVTKESIPEFIIQQGFENVGNYPDGIWWTGLPARGKDGAYRKEMTMPPSTGTYAYRAVADGYEIAVKKSVQFAEGETEIDFALVPVNK